MREKGAVPVVWGLRLWLFWRLLVGLTEEAVVA